MFFFSLLNSVISHRFEKFWLRIKWSPTYGLSQFSCTPLTYDNWDATALTSFYKEIASLQYSLRFWMAANTSLWGNDWPNLEYGVICKFGKFPRDLYKYTLVIYDALVHDGMYLINLNTKTEQYRLKMSSKLRVSLKMPNYDEILYSKNIHLISKWLQRDCS